MRIAVLANSYPPDARGGSGRIAQLQVDWLTNHGCEVKIWVPRPFSETANTQLTSFKCQTSIAYPELEKHSPFTRLIFHFEDLAPNGELVENIRAYKPDVLITHNLTGCGWATPELLRKAGICWIHILHDVQMIEPSGQIQTQEVCAAFRHIWRKFWSRKRSKNFGKPDVIISPSKWLLNYHRNFNLFQASASKIIPNPIQKSSPEADADLAQNKELRTSNNDARTEGGDSHKTQRKILYVGRVSKEKGAAVLVNAWSLLKQKIDVPSSELRLVIVGDGPYLEFIKSLGDPTIQCLGQLSHSELAEQYKSASLFVFPSLLTENQPTVLLEAMSYGLNIIASDIGGVGELLADYGALIPPAQPEKLATAIAKKLDQKADLTKAREILNCHQIDKVMQAYLAAMQ